MAENSIKKGKYRPTAIKPGEVRNPFGRPKLKDTIGEVLRFRLALKPGEQIEQRTRLDAIAETLISEATEGNQQAIREILDRAFGKPQQTIETRNQHTIEAEWAEKLDKLPYQDLNTIERILDKVDDPTKS
jgi:hypothetical protein